MAMLLGLDPGTRLMGWCVGNGEQLPLCGAWPFERYGEENLGGLMHALNDNLTRICGRHGVTVVAYEQPIKKPHDSRSMLRRTYGLGAHIEWFCHVRGIPCFEVDLHDGKQALAGSRGAEKDDMVAAAEKLGLALPETNAEGRKDAADAAGIWLALLRAQNPRLLSRFDQVLWGRRGVLL